MPARKKSATERLQSKERSRSLNRNLMRQLRSNPEYRQAEQARDTEAHQTARLDPSRRRTEQARDTEAHQIARQDQLRRLNEQERNTEAHRIRRLGPRLPRHARDPARLQELQRHSLGELNKLCRHCNAKHFSCEMSSTESSLCCEKGKVTLDALQEDPII
ncbi:unnamed protein product [Chilo suppressalis]|uniref:IBB domain-containing protein n=1 Tax=Chilo suppressalis TaxID=168631 RepID=A0ABN8B6X3_CHISP|nr:unnamed protein product [Chilo suppressalis]